MPMDIPEWRNVDRHLFETQILPAGRPAVGTIHSRIGATAERHAIERSELAANHAMGPHPP